MMQTQSKAYLAAAALPFSLAVCGAAAEIFRLAGVPMMANEPPLISGLMEILRSPAVLLHDSFAAGGFSAAMINAGLLGILSVLLIRFLEIPLSGPFIAAVCTVTGFAFFGKNLFNVWPVVFGVWLYAKIQRIPFKNVALVSLFGTTLAPLVSAIVFGGFFAGWIALPAGIAAGIAAGFVLPPLASHMLRFHDGYNIYNIGFTGGIVGSFIMAVLRSFGFSVRSDQTVSSRYDMPIMILLLTGFSVLLLGGALASRKRETTLRSDLHGIFKSSGRLVSDFTLSSGYPAVAVNMALLGFMSIAFVRLLGGIFNGPLLAGVFTVAGFGAFGKHPANCFPVLIGVVAAASVKIWEIHATTVIIAGLFGTTLAPIAGQFGPLAGIAAGFFHLSIIHNVGVLHGGINLYNNGFSGGFVASFLVPIINALRKKEKES